MNEAERDDALVEIQPRMRLIARKVRRRYGGKPDLDDLISAGNLAALRTAERWDPAAGASLSTWLLNRAHGAMIDWMRKTPGWSRTRGQIAEFVPVDCAHTWLRDPEPSIEQRMIKQERVQRLKDAIASLPEGKHRQVLELLLEGKTHKEVAAAVGLSVARVYQLVSKYAGTLQRRIEKPQPVAEKSPAAPQQEPKPVVVMPRPARQVRGLESVLVQIAIEKLIAYIEADPGRWAGECVGILRKAA